MAPTQMSPFANVDRDTIGSMNDFDALGKRWDNWHEWRTSENTILILTCIGVAFGALLLFIWWMWRGIAKDKWCCCCCARK